MNFTHWKTTLGGIAAGLPLIGLGLTAIASGNYIHAAEYIVSGIGLIIAGASAAESSKVVEK